MNWRAPVFACILLTAIGGIWWLLSGEQAGNRLDFAFNEQQEQAAAGSDYYMEGVSSLHFDRDGALTHELHAPRIEHDPKLSQIRMNAPRVMVHNAEGEPWQMSANSAIGDDDQSLFTLSGDVQLKHGHGFTPNMTMTTTELQLDLKNDKAHTEHMVHFVGPHGDIVGRGLDADLNAQVLHLLHEVKGRYARP